MKGFRYLYHLFKRNRQDINKLNLSTPLYIDDTAVFKFHENIFIGKYCRIGASCYLDGEGMLTIGEGTILAPRVTILTSSHNYKSNDLLPFNQHDVLRKVSIGCGCWIGFGAMIKPGVTIGDGCIIGMGSIVVNNVKNGEIVGGNPATKIGERNVEFDKLINTERYFYREVFGNGLERKGRKNQSESLNAIK